MPSKDSKTPGNGDNKVVKFTSDEQTQTVTTKKRFTITPTQIITYIILVLIAIVMVFGVFPSFGTRGASSSIQFGTYDGKPIEFSYGNYFYRQYQTQAQQNRNTDEMGAFEVWRGAFESTVFHTAVMKMAQSVGIRVAEKTLNQAIIDSGAYDTDGEFDREVYESASVERKNQIRTQIEENLPVQMVMGDIATILSPPKELEYIVEIGDAARSFSYVVFDASVYPDDLAQQYANANPAMFTLIDVSKITTDTREQAEALRESLLAGDITFEEAAQENSIDAFAAEGGRAGVKYLYELQSDFANPEEVNVLFSTSEGTISTVFDGSVGAVLYRVERAPFMPDYADPEVLSDVKNYISTYDPESVSSYVETVATEFAEQSASTGDFEAVAKERGLSVITVGPTPINVGGSSYLTGFNYTDGGGYLRAISSDAESMRKLYSIPVGSVSDPLPTNGAFVVAQVTDEQPMDEEMREYLELIYPYMSQTQSQQDMVQAIFTSGRLEDNFLKTYFTEIAASGQEN
jgi:hypothetical protein